MRFSKSLIPGVVLLCGSGLAMAEEHMVRPQASDGAIPEFSAVDADKDGVISSSEAVSVPALVEQFSEADRNADGAVDHGRIRGRSRAVARTRLRTKVPSPVPRSSSWSSRISGGRPASPGGDWPGGGAERYTSHEVPERYHRNHLAAFGDGCKLGPVRCARAGATPIEVSPGNRRCVLIRWPVVGAFTASADGAPDRGAAPGSDDVCILEVDPCCVPCRALTGGAGYRTSTQLTPAREALKRPATSRSGPAARGLSA